MPLFLLAAVAVGLPHGGLDHLVGRAVFFGRHRRRWWLPFLTGYLGLGVATLVLWHLMPAAMLGIFLLLSILHFGAEDAQSSGDTGAVAVVAHGCVPVVVPALLHPEAVGRLFRLLAGDGGAHVLWFASGPLALVWLSAIAGWSARSVFRCGGRIDPVGLAGTVLLFVIATPLAAFAIYFAVLHTPRAFRSLHTEAGLDDRSGVLRRSLPLAALGMAVGVALFVFQPAHELDSDMVRTLFLLLSALTVPHMWLRWLAGRPGRHAPI